MIYGPKTNQQHWKKYFKMTGGYFLVDDKKLKGKKVSQINYLR